MPFDAQPSSQPNERELLMAALEKEDPKERIAYLEKACGDNRALRERIESLLGQQEGIGNFLETPAIAGLHTTPVTEKPGDRIGRYKLLQQIGEGGAGVVYMAEQEEPVRRRVALKIIKLGMDTPAVIARFEAERQALAMMDHPNIARVFDAGATETGRPYFVMELVQGVRITDYCDRTQVGPRERLGLFIQVCRAIQHAHQKGIIHRDIKPSNILITLHDGVPVPKVIDFGIAKATHQRLTDKTVFTQFATFIGTPTYMSPEQAEMSGLDIDTRADIYALGVLLYELLTGKTPFEAEALFKAGLDECRRTIREEEPLRPSLRLATLSKADLTTTAGQRGLDAPRLVHLLSGDLDWIVLKCLEKDRTRRYDTAASLAMDVQNYLDDQPVLARPPSNLYVIKKVLHRHRQAFAAATAIVVTLLTGITISTMQAIRATRAEKREVALRERAVQGEAAARLNEYVADINLVQRSLTAGNYGRAVQLLNKHRPQAGEADLRGFEWRYLWEVSQGDEHVGLPTQDGAVQALAFSPKGDLLVMGLPEKLMVWDTRQHSLVTTVPMGAVSMMFSPDGKSFFAADPGLLNRGMFGGPQPGWGKNNPSPAGKLTNQQRWRRPNRRPQAPAETGTNFLGRPEGPMNPDFGREGRSRWPGGFAPPSVRVWNTADWSERKSLAGNAGPIAVSRDGKRMATMAINRETVRVLDTASWEEVRLIADVHGPMAFSPDGKMLATDSRLGIQLWSMDDSRPAVVLPDSTNLFFYGFGPGPFSFRPSGCLSFSPDGKFLVATRNTLSARGIFVLGIWNVETGAEAALPDDPEHVEHTGAISAVAFSPDGQLLATASMDYSIRLWDFAKRQRLATLQGHLSEVWSLAFSPDGKSLVSGAKDGSVKVWPVSRQEKESILPGPWQEMLAISKDSQKLAARDRQGTVAILDLSTGDPEQEFPLGGRPRPLPSALSENFRTLAHIREDGHVQLLNTETHESVTLEIQAPQTGFLALSPDARYLVTGGRFGRGFRCYDLDNKTNQFVQNEASRALFSPDGSLLASFQQTNQIQIWDVGTWRLQGSWVSDIELRNTAAAFSPKGDLLAVACADDTVYLWDTLTGKMVGACSGHKQAVSSVAFSPDGKTLATSSDDRMLKLWNVATQQELLSIRNLDGALRTLLFSPNGSMLVARISTLSSKTGLRFYRAPLLKEIDGKAGEPARNQSLH